MSVSISLLLNDYTSLEVLALDISHILNIDLNEENSISEHYFYSYLSSGQYFSLGYQNYLENDNAIDFENFKYIINIYLNKVEIIEYQVENISIFFKKLFYKLKNKYDINLIGLLVYDNQGLLARLS